MSDYKLLIQHCNGKPEAFRHDVKPRYADEWLWLSERDYAECKRDPNYPLPVPMDVADTMLNHVFLGWNWYFSTQT